jgi:hypothetical protein
MLELASTPDEVEFILQMAEERGMCKEVSDTREVEQWKNDLSKSGLLAFTSPFVWAPTDFTNKTHQALMLSARNALGRIRRQREQGHGVGDNPRSG